MESAGGLVGMVISGVIFSVEIVLSAELDKEGLGGMIGSSVWAFLVMGLEGEGVFAVSRFLLLKRCDPDFGGRLGVVMGSLGPLGESELGVGDHWAGGEVG